jgi:hypothetical protein
VVWVRPVWFCDALGWEVRVCDAAPLPDPGNAISSAPAPAIEVEATKFRRLNVFSLFIISLS